ncbi:MAG: serine hydrolase domain-containing protein [Hellea sp.]
MTKYLLQTLLVSASALIACGAAFNDDQAKAENLSAWEAKIDRLAMKELKRTGIPSLQLAIGHKGEVVFEKAYGFADIEEKSPATPQTQYRTASISKWFSGTAAMSLVDDKLIDVSAPIQDYCPAYPKKKWEITTTHLLSHTSGIRHYKEGEAETPSTEHFTDVIGPLDSFKDDDLIFEPGMGWSYSSHGYRVLGCVISGASGKTYNDYIRQAVFTPAGMAATAQDDATAPSTNLATGYELVKRKKLKPAPTRDVSENLPAGGHISTASDLVRFSQSFDQGKLVSKDSIGVMSSLPKAKTGVTLEVGYGHGVDFMGAFPGSIGHGGRQEGTTTLLVLLPEQDISVAVMTNARGWGRSNKFTQSILDAYETGQDK